MTLRFLLLMAKKKAGQSTELDCCSMNYCKQQKKHRKALQGPSRQPGGCLPTSHTKCIQISLPQLILHEQFACSQATFRTTISCT